MSLSDYYCNIAELDVKRAKLRSSNLADLYCQQSITARLVAEERQHLSQAGQRYRAAQSYAVRFAAYGDPYVFDKNGYSNGETVSTLTRKNRERRRVQ